MSNNTFSPGGISGAFLSRKLSRRGASLLASPLMAIMTTAATAAMAAEHAAAETPVTATLDRRENLPIPEIVVTADLQQDTVLEMAGSVAVMTEEAIKARAAQHIEDIIHAIPNVNFASGSNRARYFQIRGMGERSQFIDPINPSVGVLIDDVDFSGAGTIATLMDVQQVEVLRGPQGTRYGAGALAGLVNITTNPPGDEFLLSVKASVADYDTQTYGMVVNGPVADAVNGRLVIESHKSDGYIKNDHLGREDTNNRDELTIRGKLAWQVNDNWQLDATLAQIDIDNGYDAFSLDNRRRTLSDEPGFDRQDSQYLSLKSTWSLAGMKVEALLNRADSDLGYGYDEDWTFAGFHPGGYTSTDHYLRQRDTLSAELRLVSTEDSRLFGDTTDWVFGFYHLDSDEALERRYTFNTKTFFSDYAFDTLALFTQLDAGLSETLTLSIGLRLEERDADYDDSNDVVFSPDDSLWGGRLALEYHPQQDTLLYGSISRGYKAGGFNRDGTLPAALRQFDEEHLIEYELGIKALLADGRLALQLALFHDERRDQQVKTSLVQQNPQAEFTDFISNAAEGTNQGLELNLHYALTDGLSLNANVGWLDADFDKYIKETLDADGNVVTEDLSGRDQAHAPGYMYSLGLSYLKNWGGGNWFANISVDGKDEFYFSDSHAEKSKNYSLWNVSLGFAKGSWKLTLWGRNLADKDYHVRGFYFGNNPAMGYADEPYYQFGEPRLVGVSFSYQIAGHEHSRWSR